MKRMLVTGSAGLIGSEVCLYFAGKGWRIYGADNNQRRAFFGDAGDTSWNLARVRDNVKDYAHYETDMRDRAAVRDMLTSVMPDVIVHTAAQPSHDLAARIPFQDFDTNAVGTMNLLENARQAVPDTVFIHMSTNKVYGDAPNELPMVELETRWDYGDERYTEGIPETMRIDRSKHSLFGASKAAADLMVQEYGRYFGMKTCCLRGGCLTGPNHSGVELHGFLSYLVKCVFTGTRYTVFGYKGKQVRDNIHSYDVARFMEEFINTPRCGEVYNIGGGKGNTCSILEAFSAAEAVTGKKVRYEYVEKNREGDHICYYSDLRKMRTHYPGWAITRTLPSIFEELAISWRRRTG